MTDYKKLYFTLYNAVSDVQLRLEHVLDLSQSLYMDIADPCENGQIPRTEEEGNLFKLLSSPKMRRERAQGKAILEALEGPEET